MKKAILTSWITVVDKIGTFCPVYYAKKGEISIVQREYYAYLDHPDFLHKATMAK
ncbi:MAG: hypothetical protein Q8Q92_02625 [bacterium]|nr:hypothetical protein [bacterium]